MMHFTLEKHRKGKCFQRSALEPAGGAYSASPDPLGGFENVFTYFPFVFSMHLVGTSAYQQSHCQVTILF